MNWTRSNFLVIFLLFSLVRLPWICSANSPWKHAFSRRLQSRGSYRRIPRLSKGWYQGCFKIHYFERGGFFISIHSGNDAPRNGVNICWNSFSWSLKENGGICTLINSGDFCLSVNKQPNHNYEKIVKSDWLSTALISALIGQFNRTVRAITRALKWPFFHC